MGLALLFGLFLLIIDRLPALPSSSPILPENSGAEVREYISENLLAIVFSIVSLTLSLLVEIYGFSACRNANSVKMESNTIVALGLFILASGVWILTDSKILSVFTTDYGGPLDKNMITFISYISFMLLPIIFLSFLQQIMQIAWLWKMDILFTLNLSAFVVLSFFHLSKNLYFALLIFHHLLIYFLVIVGMVYCIRNFRHTKDQQKNLLFRGLIYFMSFSTLAMIVFLLNHPRAYALMYSIGFFIMIWYMIRLTVQKVLSAYNQAVKSELYQSLAYTDILTSLKNRNALITEQYNRPVQANTCCIVLDINRLKWVNDTLGHSAGDELIRRCANIVCDSFADIGACYRIGGDEFAVVCQKTDEAAIKAKIEKLEALIAASHTNSPQDINLAYGYAFGNQDTKKFVDLFNAADGIMYTAKRGSHAASRNKN